MSVLHRLRLFLLDRTLNLLDPRVKTLFRKVSADDVRKSRVNFHTLGRAEVMELHIFELDIELVIDECGTGHHSDVFEILFLHASGPWHIDSTTLQNVLLIVVDHGAHRFFL